MKFLFTARHFKAHDNLKETAQNEADKLKRFYDGLIGCEVILSYEKAVNSIKTAEVIITANSHHVFKAIESSEDFKVSLDSAFNKVEIQLRKFKDKIRTNNSDKEKLIKQNKQIIKPGNQ
jgi:putative sigma-54 modulation protein